jgi:aminomuconate-semialdehyde/2-hydroxymuconate-6-semialdehyde dehydrogenase
MVQNFIDGSVQPVSAARPGEPGGGVLELVDPATGKRRGEVACATAGEVDRAVAAARAAFPAWSAMAASKRSEILLRLADLIDGNLDELAKAECLDSGKPIFVCRSVDIPRSAANFRYFAQAVLHTTGQWHQYDGAGVQGARPAMNFTLRSPRGVAGLISPWNLPLYLLTWKIAPALATGNTAVCKPSELTPTTATMLAELGNAAGLPPGVLNILHGTGQPVGSGIVTHPDVPTVSFTGSTGVGKWIAREAGDRLKRVSLELGGKNPFVVFADADLDVAAETACRAMFSNQGQICLCGSRLVVHKSVREAFLQRLLAHVAAIRPGDPMEPATRYGTLISQAHREKVERYVAVARELGGRVLCGGERPQADALPPRVRGGFYYLPTIIDGLAPDCAVEQEEIFGPVVSVQSFEHDEQAVALANGTSYGLAASIWTRDLQRAHRAAAEIHAGIVWVNCWMVRDLRTPFGGAKQSGVGREGGMEAINFFTEPKNVCIGL